jgi:hypothetical protein
MQSARKGFGEARQQTSPVVALLLILNSEEPRVESEPSPVLFPRLQRFYGQPRDRPVGTGVVAQRVECARTRELRVLANHGVGQVGIEPFQRTDGGGSRHELLQTLDIDQPDRYALDLCPSGETMYLICTWSGPFDAFHGIDRPSKPVTY